MASGEARFGLFMACKSICWVNAEFKLAYQDMHLIEHSVGSNEVMGNAHAVGLHWMRSTVRIVSH